jgi:hypothetical protein
MSWNFKYFCQAKRGTTTKSGQNNKFFGQFCVHVKLQMPVVWAACNYIEELA